MPYNVATYLEDGFCVESCGPWAQASKPQLKRPNASDLAGLGGLGYGILLQLTHSALQGQPHLRNAVRTVHRSSYAIHNRPSTLPLSTSTTGSPMVWSGSINGGRCRIMGA